MFQVKKSLPVFVLIGIIGFAGVAFAAPFFSSTRSMVPESDTVNNNLGTTSPANLRYNGFFKDVSISGTCTGCGSGSAPAFTPTSWGASTTTVLGFTNGFISNASSTFPYLGTGGVGANNGRLYNYATTTFSTGLTYSGGAVTCDTASGSVFGCLASADWNTFNGKESALTFTYPLTRSVNAISLAFGTTTNNTWSGLNIFNATTTLAGGLIAGDTTTGMFYDATSGRLSLGDKDNAHIVGGVTYGEKFAIHAEGLTDVSEFTIHRHADTATFGANINLSKSRGTEATEAIVQLGDLISGIYSTAFDGVDYEIGSQILSTVDGTPGSNDMPTSMSFWTTPDGSGTSLERLTIKSTGNIGIGSTTPYAKLSVKGAGTTTGVNFQTTNSSNSPLVTILDSGNVGIGTTTPAQLFSVGNALTNGGLYFNTTGFAIGSSSPQYRLSVTPVLSNGDSTFGVRTDGSIVGYDATNAVQGVMSPTKGFGMQTGTTTTWTASTTGSAYSPFWFANYAGTIQQVRCGTDASFLGVNVQIAGASVTPSYFVASTTIGVEKFTAGNTFTSGQKVLVDFGTTTTATAKSISCSFDTTETP